MNTVKHLSYFIALVAAGSVALLLVLEPVIGIIPIFAAIAMGRELHTQDGRTASYVVVTLAWSVVLIAFWIRNKGLSPRVVKSKKGARLVLGHLLLLAGHGLVLCVMFVKAFAFLMILPIVGILFFYGAGIVLIETARDRTRAQAKA